MQRSRLAHFILALLVACSVIACQALQNFQPFQNLAGDGPTSTVAAPRSSEPPVSPTSTPQGLPGGDSYPAPDGETPTPTLASDLISTPGDGYPDPGDQPSPAAAVTETGESQLSPSATMDPAQAYPGEEQATATGVMAVTSTATGAFAFTPTLPLSGSGTPQGQGGTATPVLAVTPTGPPGITPSPTAPVTPFLSPTPILAATASPTSLPTITLTPTATRTPVPPPPWISSGLKATDPETVRLNSGRVQLVEFFAFWCGPCQAMAPMMAGLEAQYGQEMNFVYLDIDDPSNASFKQELHFSQAPHFFLLDANGKVLREWTGYVDAQDFIDAIEGALGYDYSS